MEAPARLSEGSARPPFPQPEHGFLWERVSRLPRQHHDLATVVRVVRDQVADKTCDVRTKPFDPPVIVQRLTHNYAEGMAALFQGAKGLRRCDFRRVE